MSPPHPRPLALLSPLHTLARSPFRSPPLAHPSPSLSCPNRALSHAVLSSATARRPLPAPPPLDSPSSPSPPSFPRPRLLPLYLSYIVAELAQVRLRQVLALARDREPLIQLRSHSHFFFFEMLFKIPQRVRVRSRRRAHQSIERSSADRTSSTAASKRTARRVHTADTKRGAQHRTTCSSPKWEKRCT